ncbi:phage tail protein [Pseudarthrobacter sp. J75]|uniref:phage tail protein n=1 Tax=unclassified Pseudarthrobacter TaxID=2647000 RepID=UPI002E815996|nr:MULTISPECIES: phage tail protein [unclassified Pseudarthrobacter]MEE2524075.1 phage tail protein [Pseudarthrobacter sp. J47]MEE2530354.1 phage tail protein [Pseudarthrobacter sp. J75]
MADLEFRAEDSALARVLPEVFQVAATASPPLRALLAVAEDLHRPVRNILDAVATIPHPGQVPSSLVPFLSRWVDLDWLILPDAEAAGSAGAEIPLARQRELIAAASQLSARRGTVDGLVRFLHLATGVRGFTVGSVPGAFHMLVGVPSAAEGQVDLIRRIVDGTKPAHVTAAIMVLPADGPGGAAP